MKRTIREQIHAGIAIDQLVYPDGRISPRNRGFFEVVSDIRHATYAIMRLRQEGETVGVTVLGSGFFVAPKTFLTCHHVVNGLSNPHHDGDNYQLVSSLMSDNASAGRTINVLSARANENIHLFPDLDLALLVCEGSFRQSFVTFDYGSLEPGREIGVAGYPLPELRLHEGQILFDGFIFRVAKGIVTATYQTEIQTPETGRLPKLPIIEVNFLFVPGNSGGPIFDASTGRVLGFVQSYSAQTIGRRLATAEFDTEEGRRPQSYVEAVHAVYSLGIRIDRVRAEMERFGASPSL